MPAEKESRRAHRLYADIAVILRRKLREQNKIECTPLARGHRAKGGPKYGQKSETLVHHQVSLTYKCVMWLSCCLDGRHRLNLAKFKYKDGKPNFGDTWDHGLDEHDYIYIDITRGIISYRRDKLPKTLNPRTEWHKMLAKDYSATVTKPSGTKLLVNYGLDLQRFVEAKLQRNRCDICEAMPVINRSKGYEELDHKRDFYNLVRGIQVACVARPPGKTGLHRYKLRETNFDGVRVSTQVTNRVFIIKPQLWHDIREEKGENGHVDICLDTHRTNFRPQHFRIMLPWSWKDSYISGMPQGWGMCPRCGLDVNVKHSTESKKRIKEKK